MDLSSIKAVLFDLDGTIYLGNQLIEGANETVEFFRKAGKKIFFATNNSTLRREQIFNKLIKIGVKCSIDEVVNSGYLAALFLKQRRFKDVYVFGSEGLKADLIEQGIPLNETSQAKNLLIGYDPHATYEDITNAVEVALHAQAIIACNKERTYPGQNGRIMPGCGAMTAPIEWCANRVCDFIIGKPNTIMIETLCHSLHIEPSECLMVGDTFESDIIMANIAGSESILISQSAYNGVNSVSDIQAIPALFKTN